MTQNTTERSPLLSGLSTRLGASATTDDGESAVSAHRTTSDSTLVSSASLQPDVPDSLWVEIQSQLALAIPIILSQFLQWTVFIFAMLALGRIGGKQLAAGGAALPFCNVTGYLVGVGLSSALDTLCSQAVGVVRKSEAQGASSKDSDPYVLGKILQRAFLMVTGVTTLVSVLWWNAEPILIALGQDAEVSQLAAHFIKYMLPGFLPDMLFECMRHYLQAQGLPHATTYCVFATALVNIPLTYLLVLPPRFGIGYIGAAVAISTTQTLNCVLLALYIAFVDGNSGWGGWTMDVFDPASFGALLSLAFPALAMTLFDGSVFEVLCLLAGTLSPTELAGQTILTTNTAGTLWMISVGIGFAASIRVGNEVGAGNPRRAKASAWRTLGVAVSIAALDSTVFVAGRDVVLWAYTSDNAVRAVIKTPLLLVPLHHILDACNVELSGVIRGTGYQLFGALCQFAHYVIGIPFGCVLAFSCGWGLVGLWIGLISSTALVVVSELVFVGSLDWAREVEKAAERIAQQ
ncbi:MATE efflux family protein [Gonapodya prolifera JEL478]|uniref:MATE efflux family protein n=1 Tax=Gonapodya prolifera (strain JEL478) TaxID=1344416 RepID=A0A139ACK7_GONPJ|nr:MATE efflux family protein [Gonapodya prolifera JEL478]|eukprot:KXS14500.1 MATE efflux family protein [Gonapodya prolifera JEL478]